MIKCDRATVNWRSAKAQPQTEKYGQQEQYTDTELSSKKHLYLFGCLWIDRVPLSRYSTTIVAQPK